MTSATAAFVAGGGVGGTVWGKGARAGGRFVPVASLPPPEFILRFYRDIADRGIPQEVQQPSVVVAEHTLTFLTQDEDERTNIMRAVESIHGAWIRPGETFSFNAVVGERTEGRGFRAGLMYVSGRLVSGIGGGVCIPSTALYHAALQAGLEIVERFPHSGPVSYAEPGLDAAVAYGYKDLRFRNDTEGPLLVRAQVEGNTLTVSLLARKPTGRRVEITTADKSRLDFAEETVADVEAPEGEPVVEQEGRAGFTVTVVRRIYAGNKLLRREIVSRDVVAARNRIVRINPLDDPESPEALAAAEAAKAEAIAPAEPAKAEMSVPATEAKPAGHTERPAAEGPAKAPADKEHAEKPAPAARQEAAEAPTHDADKALPSGSPAEPPGAAGPAAADVPE